MSKILEFSGLSQEEKTVRFKDKVREKLQSARNWVEWHRNEIVTFTPVVIAGEIGRAHV